MKDSVRDSFDLTGRVAVITGGAGLLGKKHAEAIAEMGGTPVLLDVEGTKSAALADQIASTFGVQALGLGCDITVPEEVQQAWSTVLDHYGRIDILINNAANNPKIEDRIEGPHWSHLESFSLDAWNRDISVGLTGAFLCSKFFGSEMARSGSGSILNIASDLALIGPDQRIYREPGLLEGQQLVKPVTYSVVKSGLLGLTRYLATYWAEKGVRVNTLIPGGIFAGQDSEFVQRLTNLIPLGRMAHEDEYKAAVVFLVSEASSYMTGASLVIDGGRTCW